MALRAAVLPEDDVGQGVPRKELLVGACATRGGTGDSRANEGTASGQGSRKGTHAVNLRFTVLAQKYDHKLGHNFWLHGKSSVSICVGWSYVWTATVTSSMIRMPAPAAASGHNVRWRGCVSAYRHRCIHQRHELPVRHHALLLTFTAWIHELAFRVLLSGRLLRDMHGTNTRWTRDASPLYYLYNYLYNT